MIKSNLDSNLSPPFLLVEQTTVYSLNSLLHQKKGGGLEWSPPELKRLQNLLPD